MKDKNSFSIERYGAPSYSGKGLGVRSVKDCHCKPIVIVYFIAYGYLNDDIYAGVLIKIEELAVKITMRLLNGLKAVEGMKGFSAKHKRVATRSIQREALNA